MEHDVAGLNEEVRSGPIFANCLEDVFGYVEVWACAVEKSEENLANIWELDILEELERDVVVANEMHAELWLLLYEKLHDFADVGVVGIDIISVEADIEHVDYLILMLLRGLTVVFDYFFVRLADEVIIFLITQYKHRFV
jgi:hypothetical protein